MSLIGSIEQLDLANVLRRIEIFAKTGLLAVKQQDVWVEFYFRQGQLVCTGPLATNATLIDRLLQAQLLSFQALPQVRSVIDITESNETRMALALINEGYLSREILRAWSAYETSQILQKIFAWTTGEIYFEEDCATPADRLLVALSISTLLDTLSTATSANPALPSTRAGTSAIHEPLSAQPHVVATPSTPAISAFPPGVSAEQFEATQLIRTPPALTSSRPVASQSASSPPSSFNAAQLIDVVPAFAAPSSVDTEEGAGMLNISRILEDDLPFSVASFAEQAPQTASTTGFLGSELHISSSTQSTLIPPQPVHNPIPPKRIDTSFMTPTLVLAPVDLSSLREQNPQVQVTPDQWSLFALVDGQISLQALCSALRAPVEQVCMVAGELMAIGLVTPLIQTANGLVEYAPPPVVPASQFPLTQQAPTWAPPSSQPAPVPVVAPMATQAQWGNGEAGAAFMVGGGWVISSKPAVSQPQPGPAYAPAGGYR